MGWGHLMIRRHINGSHLQILLEMFISKNMLPNRPLPIFPPNPGKDSSGLHFSHSERHSPGRSGLRGSRSISHILGRLFRLCSASQQRPAGPQRVQSGDQPHSQDSGVLFDQLFSLQTQWSFHAFLNKIDVRLRENKDGGPSFGPKDDFAILIFIYVLWSSLW